jgi:hypothetical protein
MIRFTNNHEYMKCRLWEIERLQGEKRVQLKNTISYIMAKVKIKI